MPDDESLYNGVIVDDLEYDDISFCVCSGDDENPGNKYNIHIIKYLDKYLGA